MTMSLLDQFLRGQKIEQLYAHSDLSYWVVSSFFTDSRQICNLYRFDKNFSQALFSRQIVDRSRDDAQYGADKPANIIGEDNSGNVVITTGGSNITDESYSVALFVDNAGNVTKSSYIGKASSGSLLVKNNIISADHGDAHFFSSGIDTNEVTLRTKSIFDPEGGSTSVLKSFYTVPSSYNALPPDVNLHKGGSAEYIVSVVNRSTNDDLISVENYDLRDTLNSSSILHKVDKPQSGVSNTTGQFSVKDKGPVLFVLDGYGVKGALDIQVYGYPQGIYESHSVSGVTNFSSRSGASPNDWVFIFPHLDKGDGSSWNDDVWHYKISASDNTDYGTYGLQPSITILDAEELEYYNETTLLQYYNSSNLLEQTVDIGPVDDPTIISGDGYDIVVGNERFSWDNVATTIKKINHADHSVEWSQVLVNEPSTISDIIFADRGIIVGGVEHVTGAPSAFAKIVEQDGTINDGNDLFSPVSVGGNSSVSFAVDPDTAILRSIISDSDAGVSVNEHGEYFSLNPNAPYYILDYEIGSSMYEGLDGDQFLVESPFLTRWFADDDGDELYLSFVSGPQYFSEGVWKDYIFEEGGELYFPSDDFSVGVHYIKYLISDRDPAQNDPSTKSVFYDRRIEIMNWPEAPYLELTPEIKIEGGKHYENIINFLDYFGDDDFVSNPNENLIFTATDLPDGIVLSSGGVLSGSLHFLETPINTDTFSSATETVQIYDITVTAEDSYGKKTSEKISIEVEKPIQPPTIINLDNNDIFHLIQDNYFEYEFSANNDSSAGAISINNEELPSWIDITKKDGSTFILSGTPENEDVGVTQASFVISNQFKNSDPYNISFDVENVNDAPVFNFTPPSSTKEDAAFSYQLTASDIDAGVVNETLTYTGLNTPSWLTVSSSGLLTGTPDNEDVGSHSITVQVTDSSGAIDTRTFSLTVNNVNDAPIFNFTPPSNTNEDVPFSLQLSAVDPDALHGTAAIAYSEVTLPSWLSLSASGLLQGTPTNNDVGTHNIIVRVTDEAGVSAEKSFNLTVNNINDAPTLEEIPDTSINEESPFSYQLTATDIDTDVEAETLFYEAVTKPEWISVSSSGLITGTPRDSDVGEYSLTVKVTDIGGLVDTKTFRLFVNDILYPPILEPIPDTKLDEGDGLNYQLTATDIDTDVVTETLLYEAVKKPEWMSVSSSGLITGTPKNEDVGEHSVTIRVTDADSLIDTKTFLVTVENINDAPTFTVAGKYSFGSEDQDVIFTIPVYEYVTDIDHNVSAETLRFTMESGPNWMVMTPDGNLLGMASNENVGVHTLVLNVTDSAGASDTKTFTLTVNNVNDPPSLEEIPDASINEEAAFSYQLTANDIDLDVVEETLTYEAVSAPSWMNVSSSGLISGTPANEDVGSHEVTVKVTDSAGASDEKTFTLTINNVNDAPEFTFTAPTSTDEDSAFSYQLTASDIDADVVAETLTFEAVTKPDWMTVSASGLITGTPTNDDVGSHSVTVKVRDSAGATDQKTFTLAVLNTNDVPVIEIDPNNNYIAYDADEGQRWELQLGVSDVDQDDSHKYSFEILSFEIRGPGLEVDLEYPDGPIGQDIYDSYYAPPNPPPDIYTLDAETGIFSGTAESREAGIYNIRFTVEDAFGATSSKDIEFIVLPINDPVYIDDAQTSMFRSDIENVYQIQISDEDLADSYSFTANNLPSWMSLDASTGVLSGSPTRTDDGSYNVEVTVTDGGGLSDTKVIEITATSFEYSVLGSGDDLVFGDADRDHISTGGGNDKVYSGANDDVVIVQGQGDVEVDTGSGDDRVVVEDGWSGTLFVKNGAGSNILEILGNQEDMDVGFVDGKVQLTIGNGSAITIDEQFVMNSQTGKVELSENGFEYIKTYGYDANGNALAGEYAYASYFVLGSEEDNLLIANQPSDAEANDEVFIMAGDGADIIEGNASNLMIEGGRGDDLIRIAATSGNKSVFGDIFTGDSGGNVHTQNSSYSDVVELDWSYDASEITQIGSGYRIYNDDLDATVDIYDVEILKFANDDGTWDTRYLTDGAPIGPGDFDVPAGTDVNYGDGSSVRFVLTDNSISSSEGKSSWLQVYAQVTETHMVEESYFTGRYVHNNGKSRSTPRSGYKPEYKTREVEQSTESEKLVWEGDKTSVDAFTFSDGVVVNVINVADKDWNDQPIEMTLGTDGIDLIFGNDSDNLIDAGLGDDIIFGGDGDDVIIGGEGDDILLGGDGDDIIRGDTVTDQDAALEYFAELTNYDDSQLSIDNSDMGTGGDDVILGGDGIDDIDSGDGTNLVSSGRMDLDGDGEADLDIVKDFMEDNNIDNKDIFDNDDWV